MHGIGQPIYFAMVIMTLSIPTRKDKLLLSPFKISRSMHLKRISPSLTPRSEKELESQNLNTRSHPAGLCNMSRYTMEKVHKSTSIQLLNLSFSPFKSYIIFFVATILHNSLSKTSYLSSYSFLAHTTGRPEVQEKFDSLTDIGGAEEKRKQV